MSHSSIDPAFASQPVSRDVDRPTGTQLFIDNLVHRFNLTSDHSADLTFLYQICTAVPEEQPPYTEVISRIMMLACQFGAEVRLHKALTATQTHLQGLGQLSSFLADYELQKDENFVLSNAQKPSRQSFKTLHIDVEAKMKKKPADNYLDNILNRLGREAKWMAHIRTVCPKFTSVQEFAAGLIVKYRLPTSESGANSNTAYLSKHVLLRRFFWDHSSTFSAFELEKDDNNSEEENNDQDFGTPSTDNSSDSGHSATKKRKLQKTNIPAGKTRGRVADGEDYWSKVDQWLKRLDDELGDNTAELKQSEFSLVFSMSYAKLVNRFIAECLEMDSLRTNKGLDFSSHPSERSFTSPSNVTSDPQPTTIQSFPSNSSSRLPEPHLNFGNAIAQLFSGPSTGRPF
ncbi:hypothetical protein JR316_0003209 [Psilocybe cubensis]|uniref:Uncharacterized protein n=1 Tax=Psilocybe cubensis TaxID=181762 RepID=A0ACB8H7H3_PSICU|nr:hypothetical protein JR316_0003209 [Psilocybe cubensis]KAH9483733.1 hypothetical protein JR316_0003209 [Psilocybe cubensis]